MLITDQTPTLTWTLTDNLGGSSWVAGAPLSQLTNGAPRIGVNLSRSSGSANFYLQNTWATASKPQIIALLGLGEEWEGQSVTLVGRGATSGTYSVSIDTVQPVRLPDGSLAILYVVDTTALSDDINGLRIVGPDTGDAYLIGEVVIATAQAWKIRRDWTETVVSQTKQNLTLTGQPSNVQRVQRREAQVTIAPVAFARAWSQSAASTLQKLQARLSQRQPVLVIPALKAPNLGETAADDLDVIYASALFGYCTDLGQISLVQDSNLAELRLKFAEAPAGRVN